MSSSAQSHPGASTTYKRHAMVERARLYGGLAERKQTHIHTRHRFCLFEGVASASPPEAWSWFPLNRNLGPSV